MSLKFGAIRYLLYFLSISLIAILLTKSWFIALAVSTVSLSLYLISSQRSQEKFERKINSAMPEIIDFVISGIQSGLSLNESLGALSDRGPEVTKRYFADHRQLLTTGGTFDTSIRTLQESFGTATADQLFEALLFAKSLGGAELIALLRQLGDFTRQDLALREEIEAKQGWIRNSAHLSAAAPWILLLLLSVQPSTAASFSTPGGALLLAAGVAMTLIAYLWMGFLGRLPETPRIFGSR